MKTEVRSKTLLNTLVIILALFSAAATYAQETNKEKDKEAIKAMLGCYDVEFKYTETFAPEVDYEKAYDYTSAAFEWAELVEETEDKIVIQHLLIINDTMIIKHWRQDWIYEADYQYRFDKKNKWVYEPLENGENIGKWTQNVYQVDDSPRYSGTATWTHVDGRSAWYNKADSPLPRREYTKRDDYNVMKRGNRVQITNLGWLHEQDNDKVIREDGKEDLLLAQEKGYNTYVKRPSEDCVSASTWWAENQEMWVGVRDKWADVLDQKTDLELHGKVDDKRLYEHLFFSNKDWKEDEVSDLIDKYIAKK